MNKKNILLFLYQISYQKMKSQTINGHVTGSFAGGGGGGGLAAKDTWGWYTQFTFSEYRFS